jgi:hypothetical protein
MRRESFFVKLSSPKRVIGEDFLGAKGAYCGRGQHSPPDHVIEQLTPGARSGSNLKGQTDSTRLAVNIRSVTARINEAALGGPDGQSAIIEMFCSVQ